MGQINSFHDVAFPLGVSFGSVAGPEWKNEIVQLNSGHEKRNARWAQSRRHFDAGTGIRSLADLRQVLSFFEARRGSLFAFRFRDPFDHFSNHGAQEPTALDQQIGIGDGETNSFQLIKTYDTYSRMITKPVALSVKLAVNGDVLQNGTDYQADALTGMVTLSEERVPDEGAVITAGFLFDVAVRFNTDRLQASISSFQAGEIPSIPIIEVKA
ncbi:phage distal tail protein, Rcc01695 family [Paenochrobactrum pullorum]|uniref:phage distal tail protein, Rcc01695 family n=1 Tax=Paenochrobactrum pullorum TaxID=1324351 RepID=UPI0035BC300C